MSEKRFFVMVTSARLQSGGTIARSFRYLCRDRAGRRSRFHCGASRRHVGGRDRWTLAMAACCNVAIGAVRRYLAGAINRSMIELNDHVRVAGPVAVFGGPYSNLEATRAFLDEVSRLAIPASNVVCTGDIIAYGADASATLAQVRASGCHVVMGNVEENLAAGAADCGCGFDEGSTC